MLNREDIAARVPHAGSMVLLERVIEWDAASIRCAGESHRDPANPLREGGSLPVWAGIEYAAQAAAVHASLLDAGGGSPRPGVLASLKQLEAHRERLDDIDGELVLHTRLIHADPAGAIYRFDVSGDGAIALSGQFTLMFAAPAREVA